MCRPALPVLAGIVSRTVSNSSGKDLPCLNRYTPTSQGHLGLRYELNTSFFRSLLVYLNCLKPPLQYFLKNAPGRRMYSGSPGSSMRSHPEYTRVLLHPTCSWQRPRNNHRVNRVNHKSNKKTCTPKDQQSKTKNTG
jgi:hypothetical protein